MPAPILDAAGWAKVRDTAVALQSIRAAAQAHGIPEQAAYKRARREKWPVGQTDKVQEARQTAAANLQVTLSKAVEKGREITAQAVSKPVQSVPEVSEILDTQVQGGQNPAILSLIEKREYLARVVRTPVGQVDEDNSLAQKVKRQTRTDKEGNTYQTEEIEIAGKLRALELDAKLAGEMDRKETGVPINIWGSQVMIGVSSQG